MALTQGLSSTAPPDPDDGDDGDDEDDDPPSGGGGGPPGGGGEGETALLTVAISGGGDVAVSPVGDPVSVDDGRGWEFEVGTRVQLEAVSGDSACFNRWGGDVESTDALLSLSIGDNTFVLAEFTNRDSPPAAPVVDPVSSPTNAATASINGRVSGCQSAFTTKVRVSGPGGSVEADVIGGAFSATAPLARNRANHIFITPVTSSGVEGVPVSINVTQDSNPPELFIDFPPDGSDLTTDAIDVAGRVSDQLTGFMGLTVAVNGVNAIVDVGIGTNGTFERQAVPLQPGANTITAVATDELGNSAERSITISRVVIPPNTPKMEVVSGAGQTGPIQSVLSEPIAVRVLNGDGSPLANKIVTFDVTRSDGRLSADPVPAESFPDTMMIQVRTDPDGLARAYWRMGSDAGCGNNRVEVTSTSIAGTTFFCASATPAPAVQINVASGFNQRAEAGGPAPEPLRVWVNDRCNGVSGVPVTFEVIRGGRINDRKSVTIETSDTGHAEVELTLGGEPGNNIVQATFLGNPDRPARFIVFGVQRRGESADTTFAGVVLDNSQQPIQAASCVVEVGGVNTAPVFSDVNGRFLIEGIAGSGPAHLYVDGLTATHIGGPKGPDVPQGSYPALAYETVIIPRAENSLPTPVLLPPLNPANAKPFDNTEDVELTVEGIDGLRMVIRAGSMTRSDGTVPSPADPAIVSLNQVHADKIPMPMPDGAAPPFAWTLQPAGAHFDPPVEITYPNMSTLPAGAVAYFLSFDHDTNKFEIVATGHVSDDASVIRSDPGDGIRVAGWGCNCPPYSVTGECCDCDDCEECEDGECVSSCGSGESCCDDSCCANVCCEGVCCGEGEFCVDGECSTEECETDDDCEVCYECVEGECQQVEAFTGCDDENVCTENDECTADFGWGCNGVVAEDNCGCDGAEGKLCGEGAVRTCVNGECIFACESDADCIEGETCVDGECVGPCKTDDDCEVCYECVEGECQQAEAFTACDDENACTENDECTADFGWGCNGVVAEDNCGCDGAEGKLCGEGAVRTCVSGECIFACESDADCIEGETCVDGECVECETDDDCAKGEVCLLGECVPGCESDADCDDGIACTDRDECDTEVTHTCINVTTDCTCATVQDGDACCCTSIGGFGTCSGGECVVCVTDSDCFEGEACVDGDCVQCEADGDCSEGEVCLLGECVPGCESDADCDDGIACTDRDECDTEVTHTCINVTTDCTCATVQDGDACCCTSIGGFGTCSGGECVVCVTDSDCFEGEACVDGDCVQCEADGDCSEGEVCLLGECVPGCESDADCDDGIACTDRDECDTEVTHTCINVTTDCTCATVQNGDACCCTSIGGFGTCSGGECVVCVTDSDCFEGETCVDGDCVPDCAGDKDCGECQTCVDGVCEDVEANTPCDDENPCTENDVCIVTCAGTVAFDNCGCDGAEGEFCGDLEGICRSGVCVTCEADDDCVEGESCINGQCVASCATDDDCAACETCFNDVCSPLPDGAACDPNLPCTPIGLCEGGVCSAEVQDCSFLDDECNVGQCDPVSDQCLPVPRPDGTPCTDLDPCTDDQCVNGTCESTKIPGCP